MRSLGFSVEGLLRVRVEDRLARWLYDMDCHKLYYEVSHKPNNP